MAQGYCLTIGLNSVDPGHYGGWDGKLVACESDAVDMTLIAQAAGFHTETLLTAAATRQAVIDHIGRNAQRVAPGDIFMLSYSGHGGQLPDLDADEADHLDETWCLFDGQLVDDELYAALSGFPAGVRILVFSDSCHSGTVIRAVLAGRVLAEAMPGTYRAMPQEVAVRTYLLNRSLYDPILKNQRLIKAQGQVNASAILISGCQDNQLSLDGVFNGLFTGTLKAVWNGGQFRGDYPGFCKAINDLMPPSQTPNYFTVGAPNPAYAGQAPFTI